MPWFIPCYMRSRSQRFRPTSVSSSLQLKAGPWGCGDTNMPDVFDGFVHQKKICSDPKKWFSVRLSFLVVSWQILTRHSLGRFATNVRDSCNAFTLHLQSWTQDLQKQIAPKDLRELSSNQTLMCCHGLRYVSHLWEASIAGSSVCVTEILCNFERKTRRKRWWPNLPASRVMLNPPWDPTAMSDCHFSYTFWIAGKVAYLVPFLEGGDYFCLIINCHVIHCPIASHLDVGTIAEILKMMAKRNPMTLAREMLRWGSATSQNLGPPQHESRNICGRHMFFPQIAL